MSSEDCAAWRPTVRIPDSHETPDVFLLQDPAVSVLSTARVIHMSNGTVSSLALKRLKCGERGAEKRTKRRLDDDEKMTAVFFVVYTSHPRLLREHV